MAKNYVLLVDDDHFFTDLLTPVFDNRGYNPVSVHCGRDALKAIKSSLPYFVVLDINLPDISGFEVLRAIRGEERSSNIPVFMLTGYGDKARQLASFDIGATEFFAKKTSLRKVIEDIEDIMWYREPIGQLPAVDIEMGQPLACNASTQMREAR